MARRVSAKFLTCQACPDRSCATEKLGPVEMDIISRNRFVSDVRRKTTFLHAGSPVSHIVYLRSGLVKEFFIKPEGGEQILQIIMPHSYLGLTSLFGDKINHFSYTALTDLKVCYIDIETFTNLIKENGSFAFDILKSAGRENLYNYHRFISQSNKKIYGRVADLILYFSKVIFSNTKFHMPLSRREVADMVSASRESAGRVLSKFNADGIIQVKGKNVIIKDMKTLQKISKFG